MRAEEAFCGVRVLDYVIMSNHFHLVCEVPDPRPLSQSEVLERIGALYGRRRVRGLKKKLAQLSQQPDGAELCHKLLEPFRKRMNDISIFICAFADSGRIFSRSRPLFTHQRGTNAPKRVRALAGWRTGRRTARAGS